MMNEETGNRFFTRFKSAFSASQNSSLENEDTDVLAGTLMITSQEEPEEKETVRSEKIFPAVTRDWAGSVTETEIPLRTVGVSAPVHSLPDEKDLDIRFATKFIQQNGKFIFCESMKEAIAGLQQLKVEQGWQHVFCWENEIRDAFGESNFQKGAIGFTIENSEAAISLCECLIADEGTIILNPKQASRRRLPCFPKTHIIITDIAHLAATEAEGLEKFYKMHKGELPSIIKLGTCNDGHFYDKKRLILNAEGPEDIYVFLVDAIIPPSLRP